MILKKLQKYLEQQNKFLNTNNLFSLFFIIITLSILFTTLLEIYYGRIPFWYDPARDMLLGLQNLKNFTLIGQPTGIPGVFYGPYWVWLISLAENFNKSPRFIAIFVLLIPYFTLFLFFILRMGNIFSRESSIIIWLLFIIGFGHYFSFIWNPHLTPLFLLIFIYLTVTLNMSKKDLGNIIKALFAGICLGLSANFSMSIGIGLIIGTVIFLVVQFIFFVVKKVKINKINYLFLSILILLGIAVTFMPFFVFELRHGFNQIQSYITASTNRITGLNGLTDMQIILTFLNLPSKIFLIHSVLIYIIIGVSFLILKVGKTSIKKVSENEIKLIILLCVISASVLSVYLLSKNPVWDYHFIGFEVILLLLFGIIINRHIILKYVALVIVGILFIVEIFNFNFTDSTVFDDSLRSKEIAVKAVIEDAQDKNFSVFAYSPSIYTFEYDYLFSNKSLKNLNSNEATNPRLAYFIFDKKNNHDVVGFVESKTNSEKYKTIKTFKTSNGTLIIKRELILN